MWRVIIPEWDCQNKKLLRWWFIPKWIRHVNGMSTTKDLLNDMYYILRLRCGSFQNEPDMFTKSIKWPETWSEAWRQTVSFGTMWKLECSLTFYIPVWASSWGTRLYIIFRSLSNIISLIWQTTAELYLLRFLIKLQHMQQKQTFMAGQDYMGTLLASKYTNSSQSIVGHNEQIFIKGSRLVL